MGDATVTAEPAQVFLFKNKYYQKAKITPLFHDTDDLTITIKCFNNINGHLFVEIDDYYKKSICLDYATAIKFSKELKKSISNIKKDV
jgi:hypothetical protein